MTSLFRRVSFTFSCILALVAVGCAEGGGGQDGGMDASDMQSDIITQGDAVVPDMRIIPDGSPDIGIPDMNIPDGNVPDTNIPDNSVPDNTVPDADVPDNMVPDATPDAPLCMVADCDDGLVCNGAETCGANNQCAAGTAPNCNDNIPCTVDSCAEPGGCANVPNDSACPGNEVCDPAMGCTAPTCSESPCKLIAPQCGCLTGDACYLSANGPVCAGAGTVQSGGDCSNAQCAPGFTCITDGPTALCRENCAVDADCAGSSQCLVTINGGTNKVCTNPCTPDDQLGCSAASKCDIFSVMNGNPVSDCSAPGTGQRGTACTSTLDCARGLGCFNVGTPTCRKWCRVGFDSDCTGADRCLGFPAGSELIVDGINYGACAP